MEVQADSGGKRALRPASAHSRKKSKAFFYLISARWELSSFFALSGQRFRFPPSRHLQCALNTFVDITNAGGFIVGVFFFSGAQFGFVRGSNIVCMRRWLDGLVAVVGLRRLGGADEDPNVRCRRRRPLHRQRHPAEGLQRNTR